MNPRTAGPALLLLVGAATVLAWGLLGAPSTEPAPPDPVETAHRQQVLQSIGRPSHAGHDHAHDEPKQRQPASDPRPDHGPGKHPPLDDEEAWRNERAKTAADLHEQQLQATEVWADGQGLTSAAAADVLDILDQHHLTLRTWRQEVELGERSPRDLRAAMTELRRETRADLLETLGPELTESLRVELSANMGGGF